MASWGRFVYRRRRRVLAAGLILFAFAVAVFLRGATFRDSNSFTFESGQAAAIEGDQLPQGDAAPTLGVIYTGPDVVATSTGFKQAVAAALAHALADNRIASITTPWTTGARAESHAISRDGHSVVVDIAMRGSFDTARANVGSILQEITPATGTSSSSTVVPHLTVTTFGELAVIHDQDTYLANDLTFGAAVSIPLALILLVLIFGGVVAAIVCVLVGVAGVTGGLAGTAILSHLTSVSPYASDIVGLVGLGVGIDYSLFIVSRFREELGRGATVEDAVARAMATSGRAIVFSGVTVAVGLSAMLFFAHTFLVSMGAAGAIVVGTSLLFAMTLLPAMLSLLGPHINRLAVPFLRRNPDGGVWRRIANVVMRHPVVVIVPTVAFLLLLGSPFPSVRLASADVNVLPPAAQARVGSELLETAFAGRDSTDIDVVVQFANGGPFAPSNVKAAYALAQRLTAIHGVDSVSSYVSFQPGATADTYATLYHDGAPHFADSAVQQLVTSSTGHSIALIEVATKYQQTSVDAEDLVRTIRSQDTVPGASVVVGGNTAFDIDFVAFIEGNIARAIIYVGVATFLILLLLLRSIVLPLKAVLMNFLSLSAAFGALVWIFEDGHLSGLLNFTPGPLDPSVPVLLFCIVFGLSMDYEVFLMTRMQEAWHTTHNNREAVADGLAVSGRLVTGAASIMVCVFCTFGFGHVVVVKAIGLGMAVAVFCDATLVRALVVPALMRLLGSVNWWAPHWMQRRGANPEH